MVKLHVVSVLLKRASDCLLLISLGKLFQAAEATIQKARSVFLLQLMCPGTSRSSSTADGRVARRSVLLSETLNSNRYNGVVLCKAFLHHSVCLKVHFKLATKYSSD